MGDASGSKRIDAGDIRPALDSILKSDTFARSERSRELLRYIVERDLNGEADRLKGFAIALDVFGRQDNFDPSTDAVVRVQAGRLRDLLETYYAGEGAKAKIRISIPRGSYVPAYEIMLQVPPLAQDLDDETEQEAPAGAAAGATWQDSRYYVSFRLFWGAAAVVMVLLTGIAGFLVNTYMSSRANTVARQQLAAAAAPHHLSASEALPSIALTGDMPEQLRLAFEDAIPRFGSIVYRSDRSVTIDGPLADFIVEAVPSGTSSYTIQFVDRESGIVLGADLIPINNADRTFIADHVARVMSRFLPVGGVIYAFLESNGRLNPLTECLAEGAAYFNDQTAERHEAAYRCHEKLIDDGMISPLSYADLSSLTIETITDNFDYPSGASFSDAVALSRRSVELAPNSAQSHRALGRSLLVSGEKRAALDQIREAYSLNKYDLGIAASYGNTLIAMGDFRTALTILDRATQAAPVHPTWWDFAMFIAAFQQNRHDLITASAQKLVGHERPHYCAARLIAAYLDGDEDMRQRMLTDLREEEDHVFLDNPLGYYQRMMPKSAAEKLVAALGQAGLVLPARAEDADLSKPAPNGG